MGIGPVLADDALSLEDVFKGWLTSDNAVAAQYR